MNYKSIAIREDDYGRIEAVKKRFEADFRRTTTWTEFVLILCTGYVVGRQIMENEDTLRLEVEEEPKTASPQG